MDFTHTSFFIQQSTEFLKKNTRKTQMSHIFFLKTFHFCNTVSGVVVVADNNNNNDRKRMLLDASESFRQG